MNSQSHYVVGQGPASASPRHSLFVDAPSVPRRVHRWGVDGPWLLAWGSDSATAADFANPARARTTFKHWFRRELLGITDL